MISNQEPGTSKRTVSIKRHGLNFFKKSLLNILYDLKNQGLNILKSVSYNRVMRVPTISFFGHPKNEFISINLFLVDFI